MAPRVCPGYKGILNGPDGNQIRCLDFNVIRQQQPLFYDHVIGLRDTIPDDNSTKGEGDDINLQKTIMRHGAKIVGGSFSFNPSEVTGMPFFEEAKRGLDFAMSFAYSGTGEGYNFDLCRVSNFSVSITAGDIVSVNVDVLGKVAEIDSFSPVYTDAEKLITWDKCSVIGDTIGVVSGVQAFNFSVNNNLIPIYTSESNISENLLPLKIRVGMQEVTGSITIYGTEESDFEVSDESLITFTAGTWSTPIYLVFAPYQNIGSISPNISTIPFVGVDKAFGD